MKSKQVYSYNIINDLVNKGEYKLIEFKFNLDGGEGKIQDRYSQVWVIKISGAVGTINDPADE